MSRFHEGQIVYIADPNKLEFHRKDKFGEHLAVVLKRNMVHATEAAARIMGRAMANIYQIGEEVADE